MNTPGTTTLPHRPLALAGAILAGLAALAAATPVRAQPAPPSLPPDVQSRAPVPCHVDHPAGGRSLWDGALWPQGVVPYEFDANTTPAMQTAMRQAMDALEAAAYIHFVPRTGQGDYLHILNSDGNYTLGVGDYGGEQPVNIYNWNYRFIMCHELMHTLGLEHEQCRADRDQYITVNYANIQDGWAPQYDIQPGTPVGPFDFDSVMCYSACGASRCCPPGASCACDPTCWTMTALPAYAQFQGLMGNITHLSSGDVFGLVSRYGPATCPLFSQQPASQAVPAGAAASMTVAASGAGTPTFHWRRAGVPLSDNGRITGSASATLTITGVTQADAGSYDCIATNSCGSTTSSPATLFVNTCPLSFTAPAGFAAHSNPLSIALGDFNHDGLLDAVVANDSSGDISLLRGNGTGGFLAPVNFPAGGPNPYALAAADLNGDGNLDVVVLPVTDNSSHTVAVLLGNGSGSFLAPVTYNTGFSPEGIAIADFNGDGKPDLFTANTASASVSILLGNGDGTFRPATSFPASQGPVSAAVADFNGDGKLDVAVANNGAASLTVFFGNGDGTLGASINIPVGINPRGIATGDFNGDNHPDLAVANNGSNAVSVLLGNGDGTFQVSTLPLGGSPADIVAADLNGDGKIDLAVAVRTSNAVSTFLGNGDGTFQAPVSFSAGQDPRAIAAADLNGDAPPDVVVASFLGDSIVRLLNNTYPLFTQQPSPQSVAAGQTATFTAAVATSGTPTLRWRHNGVNLSDDARISGSATPALTITPVLASDAGSYDCVAANSCGSSTSAAASLSLLCDRWSDITAPGPTPRVAVAAYDSARGHAVLFGGFDGAYRDDTWEWDGAAWALRPAAGPAARAYHATAFDSLRGVTVLFSGAAPDFSQVHPDTWEWDGAGWTHRQIPGPPARYAAAMAFDSGRGVMVLYGGLPADASHATRSDTWEYDGAAWQPRNVTGPGPRCFHAMAYDPVRHVTVLFGGSPSYTGTPLAGDTWEWDGSEWSQSQPTGPTPPAREEHAMTYDPIRRSVVLFGGAPSPFGGDELNDAWEWNGVAWAQQSVSAPPHGRVLCAMWCDAARHGPVVFGGEYGVEGTRLADTWLLRPDPVVVSQPAAQSTCPAGGVTFSVAASGLGAFTYQWQLQTATSTWTTLTPDLLPLACGAGATASATPANSPTVSIAIHPCPGQTHYQVRCVIANACGSITSAEAMDTVCPADADCNGIIQPVDIATFINAWFFSLQTSSLAGDFDGNGHVDPADIAAFVNAWFNALTNGC